jgi:hypothetical protein
MEKTITSKKPATASKGETKTATSAKKATATSTKEVKPAATQAVKSRPVSGDAKITIMPEPQVTKPQVTKPTAKIDAQAIALRAYYLWEQEGHQHGRDREYWWRAEELLKKESAKK